MSLISCDGRKNLITFLKVHFVVAPLQVLNTSIGESTLLVASVVWHTISSSHTFHCHSTDMVIYVVILRRCRLGRRWLYVHLVFYYPILFRHYAGNATVFIKVMRGYWSTRFLTCKKSRCIQAYINIWKWMNPHGTLSASLLIKLKRHLEQYFKNTNQIGSNWNRLPPPYLRFI